MDLVITCSDIRILRSILRITTLQNLRITSRWSSCICVHSSFMCAKLPQSSAHVLSSYSIHCHNYQAPALVVVDQPGWVTLAYFAQWSEISIPYLVQL